MDCKTSQVTNYLRLHASRMSMDRVIHNSSIWFVRRVGNVNTFICMNVIIFPLLNHVKSNSVTTGK